MIRHFCESLNYQLELKAPPHRIVSLSSGFTEAMEKMGLGGRIAGISEYCHRYIDTRGIPVAGDYLRVDDAVLDLINPDLILITSGVQLQLGKKLQRAGRPVFALPLPSSYFGILENIINIGILCSEVGAARTLVADMERRRRELEDAAGGRERRPSVYTELWFGLHGRGIGGRSFIHDLIAIAGGEPVFPDNPGSYLPLDFQAVARSRPDVVLGFHEPEYPVDFEAEMIKRGWDREFNPSVIISTVEKGRNIIHDGPSLLDSVEWLSGELAAIAEKPAGG